MLGYVHIAGTSQTFYKQETFLESYKHNIDN
jgi:hypothetical protein